MTQIPKKYQKIRDRAESGHSKSAAIHLYCLKCCTWKREEVRNCVDNSCFLFPYRPYIASQPTHSFSPSPKKQEMAHQTAAVTPCQVELHPPTPKPATEPPAPPESIPAKPVKPKPRKEQTPEQKFNKGIDRLRHQIPTAVFESCLNSLCRGKND